MKKTHWHRLLSLLLAGALTFSLVACSGGEGGEESTGGDTTTSGTESTGGEGGEETPASDLVAPSETVGEVNEWGYDPTVETLEIDVYAGVGDQSTFELDEEGGKAVMDQWLLDNLNVVINQTYSSNDTTEQLNMMLASNDYPAVLTNVPDTMANTFAAQGRAINLTGYVEEYGDNITRRMGDYLNMLRDADGQLYKLATLWGSTPNVAGYDFGIRYDYWLELGEDEIYETPEEYYETLKAVIANHPTNDNGDKTYGVTGTNASGDQGMTMMNAMLGAYGFVSGYKVGDDGSFTHWVNTEEGREAALLLNKMYREGLIDPDYLNTTYEDYITKLTTGQVIGNLGTWWYAWTGGHETWSVSEGDAYDINKRFMNVSCHAPDVAMEDTTLLTSNFLGSYRCVVTDKCENPADIMRYLNWENSELGNMIVGWGAPSETNNWNIDADGNWIVSDDIMNVSQKNLYYHLTKEQNGGMLYVLSAAGGWLKDDDLSDFDKIDPRVDRVSIYDYWPVDPETGAFSDEGVNICWMNYTAPAFDTTLYSVTFDPNEPISQTNQTVTDTISTYLANIVTASSEEAASAAFDEAAASLGSLGIADLEAFYAESYAANSEQMAG